MEEFLYSPLDIAVIIYNLDVGLQEQNRIINIIWRYEKNYLKYEYWYNKRKFILDIYYWLNYITNKENIDAELPIIKRDMRSMNGEIENEEFVSDFTKLDLFFKSVRIMIITNPNKNYIMIKLRSLLSRYGYKRRSPNLIEYFNRCMDIYHLKPYLKGGKLCDMSKVKLDDMIIFRIIC